MHKVLIVSDSMCRGIRRPELMSELKSHGMDIDISIRRHAGAQTHELHQYSQQSVEDEQPHGLILVGGTNDMSRRSGRRMLTDEEIANNLLVAGESARERGVSKIFICSVIHRTGHFYNRRRLGINRFIEEGCRQRGFIFIDNSNIRNYHTDGLHLTNEGTSLLKSNIIKFMY